MRIEPIRGRMNYIIGHNFSSLFPTDPIWLVHQTSNTIQEYCDDKNSLKLYMVNAYIRNYYTTFYITISQVPAGRSHMRHVLRVYAYARVDSYVKYLIYEEASDPFPGTCDLEASMSYLMMQKEL